MSMEAAMPMKCWQLHFLSLSLWQQVTNPLPRHLTFPPTVYMVSVIIIVELARDKRGTKSQNNFCLGIDLTYHTLDVTGCRNKYDQIDFKWF